MKKLAAPSSSPTPPAVSNSGRIRSFQDSPVRTRRGLWPLADGYLESNVLGGFFRGLTWFVGLFFAFLLVSGAQKVARAQMPLSLMVQYMALQMPRLILFTIPSSLLFGTVSTFIEMSSRGELTALMAGGMSLRRMLRAPLVSALVMAVVVFWMQESLVPQCELKRSTLTAGVLQNAKASQIFPIIDKGENGKVDRIIEADDFDAKKLVLTHPDIRINQQDGTSLHITAQNARWDKTQNTWIFSNGLLAREPAPGHPNKPGSNGYTVLPFVETSFKAEMALDPSSLTGGKRDLQEQLLEHNFEMVSLAELKGYRAQLISQLHTTQKYSASDTKKISFLKSETRAATFGINDKLATPLIVIAMVLVGAPLGVRPQRTAASGLSLGLSLMVLLGYYLVWTLVSQWGKAGGSQPIIAAYLPFAILAGLGTFLTWKKS